MSRKTDAVARAHEGFDRRTLLKAGAWAAPVIVLATAAPAAAATSGQPEPEPDDCVVIPGSGFTVAGGTLTSNGSNGESPTASGNFGTGWTPPRAPGGGGWNSTTNQMNPYTQTDYAVAPGPASWWQSGGSPSTSSGFLSLDDNDNRDAAPHTPSVVAAKFSLDVAAGKTYTLALPIFTSASYLGNQYLRVDVSGAGVSQPAAVTGYVGTSSISQIPAGVGAYPQFAGSQTPTITFTPTSAGIVDFTYTFTLAYVTGGARQNADIFVQAPIVSGCV